MNDGLPPATGLPNAGEAAEILTNPDMNVPGLLAVDGEDLPPDKTLGRMVLTNITMVGSYVKKDVLTGRRLVVIDKSRPEMVPDILLHGDDDEREEWIGDLRYDTNINLLGGIDEGEFGESIRKTLMEDEMVYDGDTKSDVPGYYDPSEDNAKREGEQRAWVVIGGS